MATMKTYTPNGADFATTSTDAKFALQTRGTGENGSEWLYVQAQSAITQYMWVGVTSAGVANPGTKAHLDDGRSVGVAQAAFAASEYGWVAVKGGNAAGATNGLRVRAKNACLPFVDLYSSSTAGYVDDTSASQKLIQGLTLTDTATSSGAAEEFLAPVTMYAIAS